MKTRVVGKQRQQAKGWMQQTETVGVGEITRAQKEKGPVSRAIDDTATEAKHRLGKRKRAVQEGLQNRHPGTEKKAISEMRRKDRVGRREEKLSKTEKEKRTKQRRETPRLET